MPTGIYKHHPRQGFQKEHSIWKHPNCIKHQFKKGEKNLNWKKDTVGKRAVHRWIARQKGKPKICKVCGKIALDWANKDHKYKRNLDDYISLCRKCHKKYDNKLKKKTS